MFDLARDLDPVVLALLPDREGGTREVRIVECAERDGDKTGEFRVHAGALVAIIYVRPAVGAEVEDTPVPVVRQHFEGFGLAFDLHLLRSPARLHGEGAARPLLAVETMAD